jgi:hypothetical protein
MSVHKQERRFLSGTNQVQMHGGASSYDQQADEEALILIEF